MDAIDDCPVNAFASHQRLQHLCRRERERETERAREREREGERERGRGSERE